MEQHDVYRACETRYADASYRPVGRSGLRLSAISLGLWHNFGSIGNFEVMRSMCRTAFDAGITCFDLANNYGPVPGSAEENFGRVIARDLAPYRDELVITTKAGFDMWSGPYGSGGSRKHMIASCDASLKRMGVEYVDIFYHHRMTPDTPIEETMEALAAIVRAGKALYAGISNYDTEWTSRALALAKELHLPLVIHQKSYSMLSRGPEQDGTLAQCERQKLGLTAFSALAQGLLTDRYLHGVPDDSRIARDPRFLRKEALTPEMLGKIRALNEIAALRGQSLAQMALAWVLRSQAVCSVIIGASKPEQILDNVRATQAAPFSQEELARIDAICL